MLWYSQENTYVGVSFLLNLQAFRPLTVLKGTWTKIFSCEHQEIYKNTYFKELEPATRVVLACIFINKETLAQVFSCEFCEISRNTFFTEHLWATVYEEHLWTAACAFLEIVL